MPTLEQVRETHTNLCFEALQIVSKKGMDYNRYQQNEDTLFNVKATQILGVVDHATQGVLVRLIDKMMRLVSLTKDPFATEEVKDESVKDTVKDAINYLVYLYCLYKEARESPVEIDQKKLKKMIDELPSGPLKIKRTSEGPFISINRKED